LSLTQRSDQKTIEGWKLNQNLKIALVCKKYSLNKGGLERYTVFLSRELLRAGHEVHIFANAWQNEQGMIMHHVPMLRMTSPLKNLSFAYFSKKILPRFQFDIIHSMERIFYQDIFRVSDGINPVQMQQRYPDPIVRRFKSVGPRRLALSYLERQIFERQGCKIVMANSELVKRQIVTHYKINPQKITVIYNGVNTSRFHPGIKEKYRGSVREKYGVKEDERLILFIANDFKLKQLGSVLDAIALLKDRKIKVMVIGSDDPKPYVKRASEHRLDRRIRFLGPRENIEIYYAAGDIFVLPTLYDAFANVCLEAMACGLPVITTRLNGAADLIDNGKNGFILQTRRPEELAERIEALGSFSQIAGMGENAAVTARAFSMEKHLAEILSLYNSQCQTPI
jgi:UDP-glucose:(heptosyl)LPS alpha-1,3-glucosyltransferase